MLAASVLQSLKDRAAACEVPTMPNTAEVTLTFLLLPCSCRTQYRIHQVTLPVHIATVYRRTSREGQLQRNANTHTASHSLEDPGLSQSDTLGLIR